MIPMLMGIAKARNDYTIANKRTSAKKKAALKNSFRTAIIGSGLTIILAFCFFVSEGYETERKERSVTERHLEIRTNLMTTEQIGDAIRTELKLVAKQQDTSRRAEFQAKYPSGFAYFSVAERFVSVEMQNWPPKFFEADWNSATVKSLTENEVRFTLPSMVLAGSRHKGSGVGMPRRTGATSNFSMILLGVNASRNLSTNLYLVVEVATNTPFGVSMVLGSRILVEPSN